jgi:hypothetical protein
MLRELYQSLRTAVCAGLLLGGVSGCAQTGGQGGQVLAAGGDPGKPISLIQTGSVPKQPKPSPAAIDKQQLRSVLTHYRVNRRLNPAGPFVHAGFDLNGDGRGEALVLLTGRDTCNKAGCRLVVFTRTDIGYRPVSTTYNVLSPVVVAKTATKGWRDLIVNVGLADGSTRAKRLVFTGTGYPKNAGRVASVPRRQAMDGDMVIGPQNKAPATGVAPAMQAGRAATAPVASGRQLQ